MTECMSNELAALDLRSKVRNSEKKAMVTMDVLWTFWTNKQKVKDAFYYYSQQCYSVD